MFLMNENKFFLDCFGSCGPSQRQFVVSEHPPHSSLRGRKPEAIQFLNFAISSFLGIFIFSTARVKK